MHRIATTAIQYKFFKYVKWVLSQSMILLKIIKIMLCESACIVELFHFNFIHTLDLSEEHCDLNSIKDC